MLQILSKLKCELEKLPMPALKTLLPQHDITIETGLHKLIQGIAMFNCHQCIVNAYVRTFAILSSILALKQCLDMSSFHYSALLTIFFVSCMNAFGLGRKNSDIFSITVESSPTYVYPVAKLIPIFR